MDFSSIKTSDVVIEVFPKHFVTIEFSRLPDIDILTDILGIEKNPGFKVQQKAETKYWVFAPAQYPLEEIKKTIKRELMEKHNLSVEGKTTKADTTTF
jgi:hypothetical protein